MKCVPVCFNRMMYTSKSSITVRPIFRAMSIRLFDDKDHASLYAQYRPTYPNGIYKTITEFYESDKGDQCNFDLAVDVGCGNGQSSVPLCKTFKHVIGYDISKQQIASSPKDIPNLTFRVGPGEDLGFLGNDSVDLITIAQALHWLDLDHFYREVRRVIKPGGVFAAYGYGNNVVDKDEAHAAMTEFYSGLLGSYWDKQRRHIDDHYTHIHHPFQNWIRIENDSISIHRQMPVEAYIGYLSTWSGWRGYVKKNPHTDALKVVKEKFDKAYKGCNVSVYWPGFMLIGRK